MFFSSLLYATPFHSIYIGALERHRECLRYPFGTYLSNFCKVCLIFFLSFSVIRIYTILPGSMGAYALTYSIGSVTNHLSDPKTIVSSRIRFFFLLFLHVIPSHSIQMGSLKRHRKSLSDP